MPKPIPATPEGLRPYRFHGVDLDHRSGSGEAVGDCPWCGKVGKFYVEVETGLWQCKSCGTGNEIGGGNALVFIRELYEQSKAREEDYRAFAADRGLLDRATLERWGVTKSFLTGEWLVPGHDPSTGSLVQLYVYRTGPKGGKPLLLATPTLHHGMFGVDLYDPKKPTVYVCEGPWDGMALGEILSSAKESAEGGGKLTLTTNESSSLAAGANVVAAPGANSFPDLWLNLFAGKKVVLLYDNDHPREHQGRTVEGAGPAGMRRVAGLLSAAVSPPSDISYLRWGGDGGGHDPSLKSGYDVRDYLSGPTLGVRVKQLEELLGRVAPIPEEWEGAMSGRKEGGRSGIEPLPCSRWSLLSNAWKIALRWRQDLDDVLSVMLAVALSTDQVGDQLFLQVIGDAGSGKTRFCDGMLVSKRCHPLEHITGFHSGWKGEGGGDEDYSLLARINHKTLITPEGDVMISSPKFDEIMSQQRRIFDGTSGATYKNRKVDAHYTGLRTPWIMAGTPALTDTDQSRLGDRFLRVHIDAPSPEEKGEIIRRVGYAAIRAVLQTSNGKPDGCVEEKMLTAYRLTGGYVDHLRANSGALLNGVAARMDHDLVVIRCHALADFTAKLRARPPGPGRHGKDAESEASTELPSRLQHQFVRLTMCVAVVLNRDVDVEVLRRVTKVALDTSRGRTLRITRELYRHPDGIDPRALALRVGETDDKCRSLLRFMKKIKLVEHVATTDRRVKWRLTSEFRRLYREVTESA